MAISTKTERACSFAALLVLIASPGISLASASCPSSVNQMNAPDGAQLFMAASTYEGLAVNQVFDEVQTIAGGDGYVIATRPDYHSPTPSLGIGRPPSPVATLVQVQPPSQISFTSIVPSGVSADPIEVRTRLCALVDKFNAGHAASPGRHQSVKSAAEVLEESRTTMTEDKPVVNLLEPKALFDLGAAKAALEPGQSIIRGQVCGSWRGNLVLGTRPVLLYPSSPYLEQLVALAKKAKPGRDQVLTDPNMVVARMEAKPNKNGEFQFSKMKPGKYFLVTSISAMIGGSRDVYAGKVSTDYGSANVYTSQSFSYGSDGEIERFVEVRKDGDTVKVTMQPRISPFAHAGLGGSILGCMKMGMRVSHGL